MENQPSFRQKLARLFNLLFILLLAILVLISIIFARVLNTEVYHSSQEKLNGLSSNVRQSFNDVESLAQTVLHNNTIITDLPKTAQIPMQTTETYHLRQEMQREVNTARLNIPNIKDVYLLNNKNENQAGYIFDSGDIGAGWSVSEIKRALAQQPNRQGRWFFSPNLTSAFYAQTVFDAPKLNRQPLGLLIIVADTSFIQSEIRHTQVFNRDDYFVMRYQHQLYTTETDGGPFKHFLKTHRYLADQTKQDYQIQKIQNQNYYFLQSQNETFGFYYFIHNRQILTRVIQFEAVLFILMILILSMIYFAMRRNLNDLVAPIQNLAQLMGTSKSADDLAKLKSTVAQTPYLTNQDEVGVLYRSFDRLIINMDELVVKNYQAKILTREMELKSLQAQIDPHFLYNTLDSINMLALSKGDQEISEMVTNLALLFRQRVKTNQTFATVATELKLVDAYIKIQTIRFGQRLAFSKTVAPDTLQLKMPSLMIQPLIENSMKYALSQMAETTKIQLIIQKEKQYLVIQVIDNGPGFKTVAAQSGGSTHVGLANIKQRLARLYNDQAQLTIDSTAYQATKVQISIPLVPQNKGKDVT
ncbi:sensor histidine kinase [Agrilactobacillus fermenti]|uniref:sensor histidine kinase n=1 Tax=Agrilactobacillus fermenti TaxID=2586909 RepID=UPI001E4A0294|nr:histidine kinase [Agrilactobacillus fermenti]MCD2256054.1 histidine kinase [Agrilactobacillus fermenti]